MTITNKFSTVHTSAVSFFKLVPRKVELTFWAKAAMGLAPGISVRKKVMPLSAGLNVSVAGTPVCKPLPVTTAVAERVFLIL